MAAIPTTPRPEPGAPPLDRPAGPVAPLGRAARDARWRRLVQRYQAGDRAAGEQLVAELMPLVRHLASRWSAKVSRDDLVQAGLLGLTKALDRFDPAHGASFTGYAVPTMLGEMRRHLRDHAWAVRVPRALQEDAMRVTSAIQRLEPALGRSPTPDEIARELQLSVESVLEAIVAGRAYHSSSLEQPAGNGSDELTLGDTVGADDDELARTEIGVLLGHVRHVLDERERYVLHLRFERDMTQTAIARRIGVSQMQVSRILRATLAKLRAEIERRPVRAAA
ncbi:MAG TPA: SigB/SigF/SigG family RNA polymerase sigma factor [Solirubrobacteraceae bacterium]|jgi:RNA polymerase sigma-B factor|nr:SigB/SigF/SigG family RNA polymerase sigma factor [Solirubrobacteraceae bacterium]